jgi:hypothetical protein
MACRFLMNFYFDLFDCLVCVGFPTYIRQSIQSTKHSFVQRFCVDNHAMFRIVGVLQPDNTFANRHFELGMQDWQRQEI